jgi:hypothetical protein
MTFANLLETAYVHLLIDGRVSDDVRCDVTTDHSASSYGVPVLVVREDWESIGLRAGQALGAADVHSVRYYGRYRDAIVAAGYPVAQDQDTE